MIEIQTVLKKAAEKSGLKRIRYNEKNLPTSIENIVVFPFFGDNRSSFILSSLLLKRIKEELKGSKYFILISWPGNEGLFPYVDEYWHVEDESVLEKLKTETIGFDNMSSVFTLIIRNLNQYFYDTMTNKDLLPYYNNGLTKDFFERFKHVKISLPSIPSSASLGAEYTRTISQKELKVFLYPSKNIYSWKLGHLTSSNVPKEFWHDCIEKLLKNNFFPIVYSDIFSYDMSSEFADNCLNLKNLDLLKVLGVMRATGCTIDFFNGISRYALCSRSPFVCFEERAKFNALKDYEINDLFGKKVQKEYIFGFSTIIESGDKNTWNSNLFDHLIVKLNKIYDKLDRDLWPSSTEVNEIVAYDSVRKIKNKKLGSRFIKIERD
jgi:hypothetical protein